MFFDLKSYLIGKHGGAYTPSADLPSYLMGKKKSASIKTLTGTPPLTFVSDGFYLVDWSISGAAGGVGDKTKNLIQIPAEEHTSNGITFVPNRNTGKIIPVVTGERTGISSLNYFVSLPAGDYVFTCNSNAQRDVTYDSYVRASNKTYARDNPNDPPGNNFTLTAQTNVAIYHRIQKTTDVSNLVFKPMIRVADEDSNFEPYGYKIRAITRQDLVFYEANIFVQEPLYEGDILTYADSGVEIHTFKGENNLAILSEVKPSNVTITYKKG